LVRRVKKKRRPEDGETSELKPREASGMTRSKVPTLFQRRRDKEKYFKTAKYVSKNVFDRKRISKTTSTRLTAEIPRKLYNDLKVELVKDGILPSNFILLVFKAYIENDDRIISLCEEYKRESKVVKKRLSNIVNEYEDEITEKVKRGDIELDEEDMEEIYAFLQEEEQA